MLFLFPWKARLKFTRAIKCVRAKFVVTGELGCVQTFKSSGSRKYSDKSFVPYFSFVPMLPRRAASVDGVVEPRVLNLIANKTDRKKELDMM